MDLETPKPPNSSTSTGPILSGFPAGSDDSTPHERLKLHRHFRSNFLPDARNLIVYLPPHYGSEPGRHFSVLYLHDGQNLFDPQTSFIPGRTWEAMQTADAAIEAGLVEPLIIVGIYNTGDHRIAEYTPTRDWKMGGGQAPLYGKLLVEELLPFIAKQYRTLTGAEHTGLGGSSLGGLVSLYLGLEYPDVFGKLAVLSPSVWWNHRSILNYLQAKAPFKAGASPRPRIWLDVGDAEGARTVDDANQLHAQLLRKGWQEHIDLCYQVAAGGKHDETSWAGRVGPLLQFLFPAL